MQDDAAAVKVSRLGSFGIGQLEANEQDDGALTSSALYATRLQIFRTLSISAENFEVFCVAR